MWRIEQAEDDALNISTGSGTARLSLRDIKYVEIRDHLLTYYTVEGSYSELGTLSALGEKLSGKGFWNGKLRYAAVVKGYTLTMQDGTVLRISQPRKKRFIQSLKGYQK